MFMLDETGQHAVLRPRRGTEEMFGWELPPGITYEQLLNFGEQLGSGAPAQTLRCLTALCTLMLPTRRIGCLPGACIRWRSHTGQEGSGRGSVRASHPLLRGCGQWRTAAACAVNRGLSDEQIRDLPVRTFQWKAVGGEEAASSSNRYTCTVCLDDFESGDQLRTLPCMHAFHTKCIDPWLEQKASCPVCKHELRQ
jgi:hypothetical protein